jgi:hypothetical protein
MSIKKEHAAVVFWAAVVISGFIGGWGAAGIAFGIGCVACFTYGATGNQLY